MCVCTCTCVGVFAYLDARLAAALGAERHERARVVLVELRRTVGAVLVLEPHALRACLRDAVSVTAPVRPLTCME